MFYVWSTKGPANVYAIVQPSDVQGQINLLDNSWYCVCMHLLNCVSPKCLFYILLYSLISKLHLISNNIIMDHGNIE